MAGRAGLSPLALTSVAARPQAGRPSMPVPGSAAGCQWGTGGLKAQHTWGPGRGAAWTPAAGRQKLCDSDAPRGRSLSSGLLSYPRTTISWGFVKGVRAFA